MQRTSYNWYVPAEFVAQAYSRSQRDEQPDDVADGPLPPSATPSQGWQPTSENITATDTNTAISEESTEGGVKGSERTLGDGCAPLESSDVRGPSLDHNSQILDPETDISTTTRDESAKTAARTRSHYSI